jgi:predicted patatin/cPLA2 family phospholipase
MHPVLVELERRIQGQQPRQPLLLICEGGGMRGIQQAAAMWHLNQLGATQAFDQVWAVSAAACNSLYFLAGQSDGVGRIYSELLGRYKTHQQLTNPLLRRPRPLEVAMSIGVEQVEPLQWDKVFANPTELYIGAVDVYGGRIHYFGKGTDRQKLLARVRASSQVPTLNGPPVQVGSKRYLDGGLADPIPVRGLDQNKDALAVVLHTWPADYPPSFSSKWLQTIQGLTLHAFHPELIGYHRDWASRRLKTRHRLQRLEGAGRVLNWFPPEPLNPTCTNSTILRKAWHDSWNHAADIFAPLQLPESGRL